MAGLKKLSALEELRVLSQARFIVVPDENPCETAKLYSAVWADTAETPAVPVPARNGLFTGTAIWSNNSVPVMSGSNERKGILAVEKGNDAPAVPRPVPPASVLRMSVSANHGL